MWEMDGIILGKYLCEVEDRVFGKKIRIAARNLSKNTNLVEKRSGFRKKYLSDRSYENKRKVRELENVLKCGLRRYKNLWIKLSKGPDSRIIKYCIGM